MTGTGSVLLDVAAWIDLVPGEPGRIADAVRDLSPWYRHGQVSGAIGQLVAAGLLRSAGPGVVVADAPVYPRPR